VGQQGWEEVADYALDWAASHSGTESADASAPSRRESVPTEAPTIKTE
jgi:hypothetical protein